MLSPTDTCAMSASYEAFERLYAIFEEEKSGHREKCVTVAPDRQLVVPEVPSRRRHCFLITSCWWCHRPSVDLNYQQGVSKPEILARV